ncbi:hypothetical protein ES703_71984 [subsurface metagenome]
MPTARSRTAVEDGGKFVSGKSGRVFRLSLLSLHIPLTATTSGVRSALLKGVLIDETPGLMVVSTLGGDVRIPRLSEPPLPPNRNHILGQSDRVCQIC